MNTIPEAALSQHIAVLGKTGSGKTSTEKFIVEKAVAAGVRVCVLDTIKSDWWGIISSASGKSAGLPFKILGGPRGHVPLHSSAGKIIGQLVGTGKLPLSIIDMADFEAGGIQRFFVDFAQSVWRHVRGVIYLVIEEAHEVAPKERAGFGSENLSIHWAKKIATGSRSKGIRLIVATQSVQQLHNRVLGSCETLIAHRITAPADQEPVEKWLKANADKAMADKVSGSLSSLPTGTAWVCSGEVEFFSQVKFPKFKTYDNTATPTSDDEQADIKTAAVDQDELRAIIGDAVKEAEANDPKLLKAEIARLKREKAAAAPDDKAIERAKSAARADALRESAEAIKERDRIIGTLKSKMGKAERHISDGLGFLNVNGEATPKVVAPQPVAATKHFTQKVRESTRSSPKPITGQVNENSGELQKGAAKILGAIAQYPDGCSSEQIAVLTGYRATSRREYLRQLKTAGYVNGDDPYVATEEGVSALGADFEPLPTGGELREHWLRRLSGGELKLFQSLVEAYPDGVSSDALQEATNYKATSVREYSRQLIARRLVVRESGELKASDELFE